jgi:hypothetical protein
MHAHVGGCGERAHAGRHAAVERPPVPEVVPAPSRAAMSRWLADLPLSPVQYQARCGGQAGRDDPPRIGPRVAPRVGTRWLLGRAAGRRPGATTGTAFAAA